MEEKLKKKPTKWPNRIVKHQEAYWIFVIAGCLELALKWKKNSFWKTTQLCGLEGYWIFYVENTGSLMGH